MRGLCVGLMLAGAILLPLQALEAQGRPVVRRGQSPPDSAAWRPLLAYIIGNLAHNVLDAAIDTTSHAWEMSFPATGAAWPAIEAHLRTVLRARPPVPGDTVVWKLTIGELTVNADTARVEVLTGRTTYCLGTTRTGGYGNRDSVFVVRYPASRTSRTDSTRFWGAARSAGVLHGDSGDVCPRPRP